jgi:hypothetical protein
MKLSNSLDVLFLVATSLVTEKNQLQPNLQVKKKSQLQLNCINHDTNLMV